MFDRFRHRHLIAALAAMGAGHGRPAAVEAYVLGAPKLARLLRAQPMAGWSIRGEVTEAQLLGDHAEASLAALIAVGDQLDLPAVARVLTDGGVFVWFSHAPAHLVAGRLLGAGYGDIWQRAAGRYWLTMGTYLGLGAVAGPSVAA